MRNIGCVEFRVSVIPAIFLLTAVILALSSVPAFAESDPPTVEVGKFNSSAQCGKCHTEIYAMWRRSLHANSVSDPIFEASYALAYRYTSGKASKLCLSCHAPVAHLTNDLELKKELSLEGISCDFCHSVVAVHPERAEKRFELKLDGVKRGPLRSTSSPAHEVAESKLHKTSEFCAGCHEYQNEDGLSIFSTYSEWQVSPQGRGGVSCQNCHMPSSPGRSVAEGLNASRDTINLHNISGGHSSEQVRKAARVRIVEVTRRKPGLANIRVEVANVGSGHYIPTGLPTRKLVLEVDVFADRKVKTLQRIYQRVLGDKEGKEITEDYRILLDAATLLSDNRLRPGEKRIEQFAVEIPEDARVLKAEARLSYLYEPVLLSPTRMSILIGSDSK